MFDYGACYPIKLGESRDSSSLLATLDTLEVKVTPAAIKILNLVRFTSVQKALNLRVKTLEELGFSREPLIKDIVALPNKDVTLGICSAEIASLFFKEHWEKLKELGHEKYLYFSMTPLGNASFPFIFVVYCVKGVPYLDVTHAGPKWHWDTATHFFFVQHQVQQEEG